MFSKERHVDMYNWKNLRRRQIMIEKHLGPKHIAV
jgi:hypothetical protein